MVLIVGILARGEENQGKYEKRKKKKDAIVHIPHPHLGCHFILRNFRCNSRAQCLLSASILQNSMVAQRLLRKLHIMPLCPIRTFFNYTFIAFVDASFL